MSEKSLENLSAEQRQALALGGLARKLVQDPETASAMKRLLAKADPKLSFPELEIEEKIEKIKEGSAEKQRALEEEVRKLRAEREQEKLHAKVREAGLDVKDVVALLEKHGMPSTVENYDLAIKVLAREAQLAEPTPAEFGVMKPPDIKEMWADPVKWREQEAQKVLAELNGARVN